MKKKDQRRLVRSCNGYCRVASAVLGSTVLSVQDPVPPNAYDITHSGLNHAIAVFVDSEMRIANPGDFTVGKATVADLQFSILYSTGDAVFSERVALQLG